MNVASRFYISVWQMLFFIESGGHENRHAPKNKNMIKNISFCLFVKIFYLINKKSNKVL